MENKKNQNKKKNPNKQKMANYEGDWLPQQSTSLGFTPGLPKLESLRSPGLGCVADAH